jgi:Flp pilus assembly protein TadG
MLLEAVNFRMDHRADGRKRGEQGFSLILLSLALFVMLGMVGLAIDLGRMFIYQNELQTFADASVLAAVAQMDGTQSGIQGADATATAGPLGTTKPNGYNFGTVSISNVTTSYATTYAGTYDSYATASSPATNNYRFIRLTASANVPLNFLPVLPGISTQIAESASATAGQKPQSSISNGGLLPFAPDAHNQADTKNFGLTPGTEYTLKWGNVNVTTCAGDAGFTPPGSPPPEHGFVDIGEGNSNANVRVAIQYGGYPNANSFPSSVSTGDSLSGVPGNRSTSIFDALANRAAQDTNDTSTTYAQYKASGTGNGRRIVTVAIAGTWSGHGTNVSMPVLGFANFLLEPTYSGTSGPICATYIGPGDLTGAGSGGTDGASVYSNVLYQ